jgi:hypothetical protein
MSSEKLPIPHFGADLQVVPTLFRVVHPPAAFQIPKNRQPRQTAAWKEEIGPSTIARLPDNPPLRPLSFSNQALA